MHTGALVAGVGQRREKRTPGDIAQAGQFRRVPAKAQDADFVELFRVDARVLGVDMDDFLAELANAADMIDVLPDRCEGSKLRPKRGLGISNNCLPHRRRGRPGSCRRAIRPA